MHFYTTFFHSVKYACKVLLHDKEYLFWCLCFPIVLGTLFQIALGNLSKGEEFVPIKTAVVFGQDAQEQLKDMLEELGAPGEDQFLDITYAEKEEAEQLLEEKKVSGILYADENIRLVISGDMSYDRMNQSILQSFVQSFTGTYHAMEEVAVNHPEKLAEALQVLTKESVYNEEIRYADSNMDESLSYFFNLIAMSCLFGCTAGLMVAVGNQANLSDLAKRKSISPVPKLIGLLGELTTTFVIQFLIVCISIFYMWVVLKVDFGDSLGYVLLAAFAGIFTGVSMGFLVGCIGKISADAKVGILISVSMVLCFLSGLMVEGMRLLMERIIPFFNRINPAALISDSFYSLTVYESHTRYFQNIGTLFIMGAIFSLLGIAIARRSRYASV